MTILEITLTRGMVGKSASQRKVVAALGLGKFGSSVKHASSPTIVGMIKKIEHLLCVKECEQGAKTTKSTKTESRKTGSEVKVGKQLKEKAAGKAKA